MLKKSSRKNRISERVEFTKEKIFNNISYRLSKKEYAFSYYNVLNIKYRYEYFIHICKLFLTLQKKMILKIFNAYKEIFHRAIVTYKDGKKSARTQ